jgi:hypothetical protein
MNEITVYDAFKKELSVFKAADAELVYDMTTPEGYEACKIYHRKLRKVRKGVDDLRLSTSKEYREKVDGINNDGNDIIAEIDAIANPRKAALDAEDAKLQKVIDDLAEVNRLKAEYEEDERLAWLEYRERIVDEMETKQKAKEDELKAKEDAVKAAAAKVIADKAEKKQARIDAVNAKALATKKQKAAVDAALAQAAKDVQDELDKKTAEDEKAAKIEAKRIANVKHQSMIKQSAYDSLIAAVAITDADAEAVIDAIASGEIEFVEIKY